MAALLTLALLSSVYAQENKNKYVKSTLTYQNRADAQVFCQSQSATSGLATILSVTDNHDARKRCDTETNGCWIGLTGSGCTTGSGNGNTCTYVWDDSSLLSTYGFTAGDPAENTLADTWITPDGPWESLPLNPPAVTSCVYLDGMDPSGNGNVNRRWLLGSCDDGSTARHAICNRVTPTQELFFYPMTSSTGATDWTQAPSPPPTTAFELPLTTNPNRCWYANDGSSSPVGSYQRSAVLQKCWAMKNAGSGVVKHLERLYPTTGFENCQLQFNIDPWASSNGEACIVGYTANGGSTWTNIGAYGSSDADTIFRDLPLDANDNVNFGVRMTRDTTSCSGCSTSTECYFNNFYLRCDSGGTTDPTIDPTIDPTTDPTTDPTIDPTTDPTTDPTRDPTTDPTIDPTTDPTTDPTRDPTTDPTSDPTSDPTIDPTSDPTIDPTSDPTTDPTIDPTSDPTIDPTSDPTMDPTTSSDSGDDDDDIALAKALFNNEDEELNGDENDNNNGVTTSILSLHFSDETVMNLCILFGILLVVNIVFCWMCKRKKGVAKIIDESSPMDNIPI